MTDITPEQQSRINDLARNLHALHLCASQQDAYEKARQIILGAGSKDARTPSISELLGEAPPERPVDRLRDELQAMKERLRGDAATHAQAAIEGKAAADDLAKAKSDVEKLRSFGDLVESAQEAEERMASEPESAPEPQETAAEEPVEEKRVPAPESAPEPHEERGPRDVRKEVKELLAKRGPEHLGDLEVIDMPQKRDTQTE